MRLKTTASHCLRIEGAKPAVSLGPASENFPLPGSKMKIELKKTFSLRNFALKESHSKLTYKSSPTRLCPCRASSPLNSIAWGKVPGQASLLGLCGNAPP